MVKEEEDPMSPLDPLMEVALRSKTPEKRVGNTGGCASGCWVRMDVSENLSWGPMISPWKLVEYLREGHVMDPSTTFPSLFSTFNSNSFSVTHTPW